jgi:hypothetical protein
LEIHVRSFLNVSKNALKRVASVLAARRARDGSMSYFQETSASHDQLATGKLPISTINQRLGRMLHHTRTEMPSQKRDRYRSSIAPK